jgi:hypothetical protein
MLPNNGNIKTTTCVQFGEKWTDKFTTYKCTYVKCWERQIVMVIVLVIVLVLVLVLVLVIVMILVLVARATVGDS